MQHPRELTTKEKIIAALTQTLYKLRYVLIGALGALLLFVIVYLSAAEIRSGRIERSTVIVERIEDDFAIWSNETEEESRESMGLDLLARIESILDDYSRLYAAQRALYIQGQIFFNTGVWEESRASFVKLADRFPKSYLAPVALVNASTAMEEAERYEEAIELLLRITEEFQTPEMPAVLFSIGRISEKIGNTEDAITYYDRLLDEHPGSGWTNIAQSRIIVLKIDRS